MWTSNYEIVHVQCTLNSYVGIFPPGRSCNAQKSAGLSSYGTNFAVTILCHLLHIVHIYFVIQQDLYIPRWFDWKSELNMKLLQLLLPVFCQAKDFRPKVFKPHSTRTMANNHAFTSMASKIDSLKLRFECIQLHNRCQAGFEPAKNCWKFYSMMAKLYGQFVEG